MRAPSIALLVAGALALALAPMLFARADTPSVDVATQSDEPIHLVVLHTNDVHGQALPRRATWIKDREVWVGGLERVAAYIGAVRAEMDGPNEGVLLLDGGDWFQGTPEGKVRDGRAFMELMASLDYDAMTLGNHEFDLGLEPLKEILRETKVPSVCANLYDGDERVGWVKPYRMVERCGLEIAIVGLISPRTPDITHPDARRFVFTDPIAEFEKVHEQLRSGVDLVIPLTHNGLDLDRALATARQDLPLIVGGHSHTYLRDGVIVGNTRIVQAGDKATVIGRVDMKIDPLTKRVVSTHSRLIELDGPPVAEFVPPALSAGVEHLRQQTDAVMSVVVGRLERDPVVQMPFASGGLGSWISDAMRRFARADVGLHNRGGIRSHLAAGDITRRHLFEVCPFPNTVVSFTLSGEELWNCLFAALDGKESVRIEVSGLKVGLALDENSRIRLKSLEVGGKPLDKGRSYVVATNSFLATGGDRVFALERDLKPLDTGVLISDLLEQEFPKKGALRLPDDNRFEVH